MQECTPEHQQFVPYDIDPRPPVCQEAEWRYLIYLRSLQNAGLYPTVEDILFYNLQDSYQGMYVPAIRKPRVYGLRTYLTVMPTSPAGSLWLGASGYSLEGISKTRIIPENRYLLRPIISNPDIKILEKIYSCFDMPQDELQSLSTEVRECGFINVFYRRLYSVIPEGSLP